MVETVTLSKKEIIRYLFGVGVSALVFLIAGMFVFLKSMFGMVYIILLLGVMNFMILITVVFSHIITIAYLEAYFHG